MKKLWVMLIAMMISCSVFGAIQPDKTSKSMEKNMTSLVNHLIRGKSSQIDQARAIAIWIASHIAYDNYSLQTMEHKRGQRVSRRLEKGDQDAASVFKNKIGTCEGYANLYERMLDIAHIPNSQVHGFVLERQSGMPEAKRMVKKEDIGHVWNKVKIFGRSDILVDVTFMSRGKVGNTDKRLMPHMRNQELRDIKRNHKTYDYNLDYFDFDYMELRGKGEYRFNSSKQLLKK